MKDVKTFTRADMNPEEWEGSPEEHAKALATVEALELANTFIDDAHKALDEAEMPRTDEFLGEPAELSVAGRIQDLRVRVNALSSQVKTLTDAVTDAIDPVDKMRRQAKERGFLLNGEVVVQMMNNGSMLSIVQDWLKKALEKT